MQVTLDGLRPAYISNSTFKNSPASIISFSLVTDSEYLTSNFAKVTDPNFIAGLKINIATATGFPLFEDAYYVSGFPNVSPQISATSLQLAISGKFPIFVIFALLLFFRKLT